MKVELRDKNDGQRKPADAESYLNKLNFAVDLMLKHKANEPSHPLHATMYIPLCRWIDEHYPKVL